MPASFPLFAVSVLLDTPLLRAMPLLFSMFLMLAMSVVCYVSVACHVCGLLCFWCFPCLWFAVFLLRAMPRLFAVFLLLALSVVCCVSVACHVCDLLCFCCLPCLVFALFLLLAMPVVSCFCHFSVVCQVYATLALCLGWLLICTAVWHCAFDCYVYCFSVSNACVVPVLLFCLLRASLVFNVLMIIFC